LQVPIRSDSPIELGVTETTVDEVLARFDNDPMYIEKFRAAFPRHSGGANTNKIIHALASFCRTLISGDSPYDHYLLGEDSALTEQQRLGLQLFNGEKFECFHCHSGINFSTSYRDYNSDPGTQTFPFFNNGLYNIDGSGDYPEMDQGLHDLTGDGRLNPQKSGLIRGFNASEEEIDALVAFLESLTDETFLMNPAFSDPFE